MKRQHFHAEFIKAKADGYVIQYQCMSKEFPGWHDMVDDDWDFPADMAFRIKPELKYPETRMTGDELRGMYLNDKGTPHESHLVVANAVIRRAIEDGDVAIVDKGDAGR